MVAKEFDSTANTRMSLEQSQVASPEAAVGEPPPAALNSAATAFALAAAPGVIITATELPVPTPEGVVVAVAMDEVTSTVAAAAADVSNTTLAPAPLPTLEGAVGAVATDEVTSTAVAAAAPNKTKDEQGDKEEVPCAAH